MGGVISQVEGETKPEGVIQALQECLERLDQIALRCEERPVRDQRSSDEICGYDDMSLPS